MCCRGLISVEQNYKNYKKQIYKQGVANGYTYIHTMDIHTHTMDIHTYT